MADVLARNARSLLETLQSKSPHRGSQASQLASDLFQLCVESVSDTEIGACANLSAHVCTNLPRAVVKYVRTAYVQCNIVDIDSKHLFPPAAYCSSILFDKATGILAFLRESVTLDEVKEFLDTPPATCAAILTGLKHAEKQSKIYVGPNSSK